jgi:hypothetical protein
MLAYAMTRVDDAIVKRCFLSHCQGLFSFCLVPGDEIKSIFTLLRVSKHRISKSVWCDTLLRRVGHTSSTRWPKISL